MKSFIVLTAVAVLTVGNAIAAMPGAAGSVRTMSAEQPIVTHGRAGTAVRPLLVEELIDPTPRAASSAARRPRRWRWRRGRRLRYRDGNYPAYARRRPPSGAPTARFRSRSSRLRISASTNASSAASPRAARFQRPAAGPDLRVGDHENLHVGVRADHGADVAAVEHRARRIGGELRAGNSTSASRTSGSPRPPRRRRRSVAIFSAGSPNFSGSSAIAAADRARLVGQVRPLVQQRLGDRAVDHAGIEVTIAVMLRRAACRACPCRMRPVRRWR